MSFSLYQQLIHKTRYARYLDDKERREHWHETVDRYMNFMVKHICNNHLYDFTNDEIRDLREAILNHEVMPSMRAMMSAGLALERDNTAGYNCSYLVVDDIKSFDEAMFILMCGSGVGFSVERQYVNKLPEIPDILYDSDTVLIVKDSKEGWAKALRQLIALLYTGEIAKWDTSKLRPAGAKLKTFGGRSSGPGPLIDLFKFVVKTFKQARGRKLTSLECHDIMCKVGEVVVVGGVRRSAMISLSNLSDDRMRQAKTGSWWQVEAQRALSNNSAVYTEKPDVGAFMQEWMSIYESKSGERGIFNREASDTVVAKTNRRETGHDWGTNPCFIGSTLVAVADGRNAVSIQQLAEENKPFPVYCASSTNVANQFGISKKFSHWKDQVKTGIAFKTGTKHTIKVTLSSGDSFVCTPEHKLALIDGTYIEASNSIGKNLAPFFTVKNKYRRINTISDAHKNQHRMIWKYFNGDIPKGMIIDHVVSGTADFIDNLQILTKEDHDKKSGTERIGKNNPVHKIEDTAAWKQNQSAASFLYNNPRFLGITNEELITNGKLLLSQNKRINFSNLKKLDNRTPSSFSKNRFEGKMSVFRDICLEKIKYIEPVNIDKIEKEAKVYPHAIYDVTVATIEDAGVQDVYDIKVEDNSNFYIITNSFDDKFENTRGVLVHNCSEIILRPYQFCNLTEVVIRADDTEKTLARKVKLATILGTIQSTLTDFPYLRKIWKKNTEEERLLGVSLTGIYDNALMNNHKSEKLPILLAKLKETAIETNKIWADKFKIQHSAAITCVKPSGTISQLVNCASGIHPRHAVHYIRRIRNDNKDPITDFIKAAGVPYEPDVMKPESTTVFSFVQEAPEDCITRDEIGAIEHLDLWLTYQRHWCEHKPSVTISVKENEWPEVGAWCWNNFDELSGVAFLPYDGGTYKQAPYETITKEQYLNKSKEIPVTVNWDLLIESEDVTEGTQTLACSASGGCEI